MLSSTVEMSQFIRKGLKLKSLGGVLFFFYERWGGNITIIKDCLSAIFGRVLCAMQVNSACR